MKPQPPVTSTCKKSFSSQLTTSRSPFSRSATNRNPGRENRPARENQRTRVSNGGPRHPSEVDRENCNGSEQKLRVQGRNGDARHWDRRLHRTATSANRCRGWTTLCHGVDEWPWQRARKRIPSSSRAAGCKGPYPHHWCAFFRRTRPAQAPGTCETDCCSQKGSADRGEGYRPNAEACARHAS